MTVCAILRSKKLESARHASTKYVETTPPFPFHVLPPSQAAEPDSDAKYRRIKHTNVEMEPRLINCLRRGKRTRRKWTSTINKLPTISSARTMQRGGYPMIQLIYMANLWRKRSKFSNKELDMRNRTGRLICMCEYYTSQCIGRFGLIRLDAALWARATIPLIIFRRSNRESNKYAKN
jgi:hypothetical protein